MENFIRFIVWTACSVSLLLLGVSCFFRKEAIRFWNVEQEIKVIDPIAYNKAVGWLWVIFGAVLVLFGIPLLGGQNSPWIIFTILGPVAMSLCIMAVYNQIEKKYRIF